MSLLALLLAAQAVLRADSMPPYVSFPEAGLDEPAAYEGYQTRLYRDARGNAIQIYLDRTSGRVVHLWADALDESLGFTARDSAGRPAAVAWAGVEATTRVANGRRSLAYRLTAPGPLSFGLFVLGSMRVERDFQYAGRQHDSLGAAFIVPEFATLVDEIAGLPGPERRRALTLLGARDLAALRARLLPRVTLVRSPGRWSIRVAQPSLDGKNHLSLTLSGDARRASARLEGRVVTIRRGAAGPLEITVQVETDGRALTPLTREQIFNDQFRRFYAGVQADTAHPLRLRRLEREVRGFELLSSREKLMAGLPNYATYFGRDMLMTALLMEPVWSDTMVEHVIAAALAKLAPAGEVSHEEALGGQAIRENAAEYHRRHDPSLLGQLQTVRENYFMVDDDFQLPVVAARYAANAAIPDERKRRFLQAHLQELVRNLAFVARQAAPYAREPVATNLVSFRRDDDGWWHPGSWRDSRVGYAGGRFAFDVNVVWVPAALRAVITIDSTLRALGLAGVPEARGLEAAAQTWRGVERHFAVALAPAEVEARVRARLEALPAAERAHWDQVLNRDGMPAGTLRFPALALDSAGRPIPVMSTDPAAWLLLEDLGAEREAELLRPFLLPYPVGLLIDGVGPVAANDVYATPAVWEMFERDLYHSPRVVWGREVNVLV
ncbi:MAG TPA: hypothetical protein VLB49_14775, partial [Gemmatimonadales bacterium]|nr:hypothetical protein [Gemmatimonadales bacterium]